MKRRYKILFVLVLVVGIGFLMLFTSGNGPRKAVEAYKRQLIAQGEKLTLAELAPPPSTSALNLAMEFTNSPSFLTSTVSGPAAMTFVAPGVAVANHAGPSFGPLTNYDQNVRSATGLRNILNRAAVLDFKLEYTRGAEMPIHHLAGLKHAETLFSTTAMQALCQHDHAEAAADLYAGADLIRLSCDEPIMISSLVRVAMVAIVVRVNWEALQDDDWTDSQLAQLQSKWESINFFTNQATVVRGERAYLIDGMNRARNDRNYATAMTGFAGGGAGAPGTSTTWLDDVQAKAKEFYEEFRYLRWKASWSYEQELFGLQIDSAALAAVERMNETGAFVASTNELRRQSEKITALYPDADAHFIFPVDGLFIFDHYLARVARAETSRRLLVTAIALKRYHLQHTNHPASLDLLVPAQLKSVPADFMDGKPLRYRLNSDGSYLLYSIGEDGEDNGGDPALVGTATNLQAWPTGGRDMVWPRAGKPGEDFSETNSAAGTNAPPK